MCIVCAFSRRSCLRRSAVRYRSFSVDFALPDGGDDPVPHGDVDRPESDVRLVHGVLDMSRPSARPFRSLQVNVRPNSQICVTFARRGRKGGGKSR